MFVNCWFFNFCFLPGYLSLSDYIVLFFFFFFFFSMSNFRCMEFALSEGDQSNLEMDHSLFVQEVLLSTLADELQPQFLEKMLQLEIGSGTNPAEKMPNVGGGSSTSGNGGNSTVSGGGSSSSSHQKSTVKSKAIRQRPVESSLHSQPKGGGGGSSGGNGSSNSPNNINNNATTATGSGASGGSSSSNGSGTQNISALKHQMSSQSSNLASRSASGTSPISGPPQSSSLTQANIVLLSGQASNIGRGLNPGGQGMGNMVGGSATPQAQSRSAGLREALVNTSSAKRNMLKHLEATKASDREPPPH